MQSAILESGAARVTILSRGCITHDWRVAHGGAELPVVLGYADPADHLRHPGAHLGVIAGRVANRIAGARFRLDGRDWQLAANEGPNQLHGGPGGLGRRDWRIERDGDRAVRLALHSPHGDQGYPGAVDFAVTVTLDGHRLTYDMAARPDRPTPVNLAQHSYYNLMGGGQVWNHRLRVAAGRYTPVDGAMIPTGEIATVPDRLDFRRARTIRDADPQGRGIDANLVLDAAPGPAAELDAPNGLRLRLWTDQPGMQVYTAAKLSGTAPAHPGQTLGPFAGICLEPQHFPDSPNRLGFPSILCTPDRPYRQVLTVEIKPETGP